MAHNKPRGKKVRLGKAYKASKNPPLWVFLKKFGVPRGLRVYRSRLYQLNPKARRHWRVKKLKE